MSDIASLVLSLENFRTRPAAKAGLLRAGAAAVPALVDALGSTNDSVRWVAARTLGEIGAPEAEAPLRQAARTPGLEMVCADSLDLIAKKTGVAQASSSAGAAHAAHDPASLIRLTLQPPQFTVTDAKEGLEIKVALPAGRSQRVGVNLHMKDADDREYIQFRTECGPCRSDAIEWALRQNAKMPLCAIGVGEANPPTFVMSRCVFRDSLHPDEVLRTVLSLAQNGDIFEKALTKEDKR